MSVSVEFRYLAFHRPRGGGRFVCGPREFPPRAPRAHRHPRAPLHPAGRSRPGTAPDPLQIFSENKCQQAGTASGKRRSQSSLPAAGNSAFGNGLPSQKKDFGFVRLQFVTFSKDILLDVFLAAKMLLLFSRIFTMFFYVSDR